MILKVYICGSPFLFIIGLKLVLLVIKYSKTYFAGKIFPRLYEESVLPQINKHILSISIFLDPELEAVRDKAKVSHKFAI